MIKETAICWSEEDRGDWDNAEQGRHGEMWSLPILTFRQNYSPKTFCSFNCWCCCLRMNYCLLFEPCFVFEVISPLKQ